MIFFSEIPEAVPGKFVNRRDSIRIQVTAEEDLVSPMSVSYQTDVANDAKRKKRDIICMVQVNANHTKYTSKRICIGVGYPEIWVN